MNQSNIYLSSSHIPHMYTRRSTASIIWSFIIAIIPILIWASIIQGTRVYMIIFICLITSITIEIFYVRIKKMSLRQLSNGDAICIALIMSACLPVAIPLVYAAACIIIAQTFKWLYGGLGKYWLNPIVLGYCIMQLSYPTVLYNAYNYDITAEKDVSYPTSIDTISQASPLQGLHYLYNQHTINKKLPKAYILTSYGYQIANSTINKKLSTFNQFFSIPISPLYIQWIFGKKSNTIGESSLFLILLMSIILLVRNAIAWRIPFYYFISYIIIQLCITLINPSSLYSNDLIFSLSNGGFMFALFFIAPLMISSPMTDRGIPIYGIGLGCITAITRNYNTEPDSIMLSLLLMNILVPLLNTLTRIHQRYKK